ncbi:hypothetical protein OAF78_01110 [Winogradskyella sp.]|nr:hypothetical protein [Winogradskyella sp.]
MQRIPFTILLLLFSQSSIALTLQVKVYDATSTVKGIKVYNKTQNRITRFN